METNGFKRLRQQQQEEEEIRQLKRRNPIKIDGYIVGDHESKKDGRAGFAYFDKSDEYTDNEDKPRFIDFGDGIEFPNAGLTTEYDVKRGIQLYMRQNPGIAVQLSGSENFKMKFTEVATKLGLEVANPELKDFVSEIQKEMPQAAKEEEYAPGPRM